MNLHEVEEELSIKVTAVEVEESRLREWLDCLRRLGSIVKELEVLPSEINLPSSAQRKPVREECAQVDPLEESMETAEKETQPEAEAQSASPDRDRFKMNLQQLRRSGEQQKKIRVCKREDLSNSVRHDPRAHSTGDWVR